jgi:hypothetical protein
MMFAKSSIFHLAASVALLGLSACSAYPPAMGPEPGELVAPAGERVSAPLVGQVAVPATPHVLATTPAAVQTASTVSLIDPATGKTLATTLTDDAGKFTLAMPDGVSVAGGTPYVLEAVKGLNGNLPGAEAARVRTVVSYVSSVWHGISGTTITLDATTTALTIGAMLRKQADASVDLGLLLDSVSGGTYTPVSVLSAENFALLKSLVDSALSGDRDPVASVKAWGSDFALSNPTAFGQALPIEPYPKALVGNFSTRFDQTGGGRPLTLAMDAGDGFGAERIGPYFYLFGGYPNGQVVQRALINPDGSLGPFTALPAGTTQLSTFRSETCSAVIGPYVYVFGGYPDASDQNYERALINADGTLGQFSNAGTLPRVSKASHAVVANGRVFIFDHNGGSYMAASINADGTLGTFQIYNDANMTGIYPVQVIGDKLYMLRSGQKVIVASLATFPLNFTDAGVSLVVNRGESECAVVGNYLYVYGGASTTVERAPVRPDGTLGAFVQTGQSLTQARGRFRSLVIGNTLYALGGDSSIERISLNSSGQLGTFSTAGTSLTTGRTDFGSAVIGDYVYAIGGQTAAIERAQVRPDGSLGAFSSYGQALTTNRSHFATAIVGSPSSGTAPNGYLYVLGGIAGDGLHTKVERAPLAADGSPGAFSAASVPTLTMQRNFPTTAVIGSKLYVFGGANTQNIEEATIGADGALTGTAGVFNTSTFTTTAVSRMNGMASVVLGNKVYLIGGGTKSIEVASIANGALSSNFTEVDSSLWLKTARGGFRLAVLGGYLYAIGGWDYGSSQAALSVERAPIATDGTLGAFSIVPGVTLPSAHGWAQSAVTGNSVYVFGGYNGTGTVTNVERALLQ